MAGMTATIDGVLAKRRQADATQHSLRLLAANFYGLHAKAAVVDAPSIDTRRLFVPCTITTQDEDRYGDIVVTAGLDTSLHQSSPVVLLNHGSPGGTPLDIAKAEDPAGHYTVTLDPQGGKARAVSWFSSKIQDSEQTFGLIQEGFLRGVSIGFRIRRFECRKAGSGVAGPAPVGGPGGPGFDLGDGPTGPGLLIAESELVEYSHCPIGVNPYALVDRVQKSICGRPLSARILKSLSPLFPPLRESAVGGFDASAISALLEKGNHLLERIAGIASNENTEKAARGTKESTTEKTMIAAKSKLKTKADGLNEETGADGGYAAIDDGKKAADMEAQNEAQDEAQDGTQDEQEDPTKDWLPGAKVLAGVHGALALAGMAIEGGYATQENENVKAALDAIAEGVGGAMGTAEECFGKQYPDYEPLGGKKADDTDGDADDDIEKKADGETGEDDRDDLEDETFSKRLTPAGRVLAGRLRKAFSAIVRPAQPLTTKRLSKGVAAVCNAAADCFAELAEHAGELRVSQRTACGAHARTLRELAAEPAGAAGPDDSEEVKRLRAEVLALKADKAKVEKAASALLRDHRVLQKEVRKLRTSK